MRRFIARVGWSTFCLLLLTFVGTAWAEPMSIGTALIISSLIGGGAGIAGGLLGKGKGEKLKKTSTLDPGQQAVSSALAPYLQQLISGGTKTYGGETTAGVSTQEETGLGLLNKYLSGITDMTKGGLSTYGDMITGRTPQQVHEEYMKYQAPSEARYLKEQLIPTFKESMVPGGTLRSTGTERGIGDIVSKFGEGQMGRIGTNIEADRNRTLQALGILPGMSALEGGVPQIEASQKFGALPRLLEQNTLNTQLEEFRRANPEMSEILGVAQNYLNTNMMASYTTGGRGNAMGDVASIIAALTPMLTQLGTSTSTSTPGLSPMSSRGVPKEYGWGGGFGNM